MPRILHISPSSTGSASARQMLLLLERLPRDRWQVSAITLDGAFEGRGLSCDHRGLRRRREFDWTCWRLLRDEIKRQQPDIVHIWTRYADRFIRTAALAANTPHIVCSVRHVMRGQSFLFSAIERWLAKRSQTVANCSIVRDACLKVGVPAERLTVIGDGVVSTAATDCSSPARVELRRRWMQQRGYSADARLIVFVGRLENRQQLKKLLWAADQLNIVRSGVVLLLIGDGPRRDVLQRYARLYDVSEWVHFLGNRDDVPQWLQLADILIAPAKGAALSSAILEAMAAGVPVIASDIAAHRAIIEHGTTGVLVDIQHRAALGGAIHRMLDDGQNAAELAARAREMISQRYSPAAMANSYGDLYRRLLG